MDRDLIRFNALRNALYHTGRRMFYDRWNRFFNFAVVVLGATAFSDLAAVLAPWLQVAVEPKLIAFYVAIIGAMQLAFDFSGRARDHQSLQRDYYSLLGDIEECPEPANEQLSQWQGKLARIAGDEPPTLRARDAKAFNDALGATELYQASERLIIPFSHQLMGWFWPFEGHHYKKEGEVLPSTER